jgi:hypothetical protein
MKRRKKLLTPVLGHLFLFSVLMVGVKAEASDQYIKEVRHYTEQIGSDTKKITLSIFHHNGYQMSYKKISESHMTRTDENMNTISWTMENPVLSTSIRAIRNDNSILIKGVFKGKPIHKCIEIDSFPWFQATSLSLKKLALSEQNTAEFWMLRPDTLNAYKLKAVKLGNEMVFIENKIVEAIKIQLRLTGWLAPFWKSHYWFRVADCHFIRFEGMQNLTGTDSIIITYTGFDITASME